MKYEIMASETGETSDQMFWISTFPLSAFLSFPLLLRIYSPQIFFFHFSAHFPHQCVVALIFGYLSCQFSVKRLGKLKKFCLAVFCLLSALTVYFKAEFFLGFDINWSLQLAHRHCQKVFFPDYFSCWLLTRCPVGPTDKAYLSFFLL